MENPPYIILVYRLNKKPKSFDISKYEEWSKLGKFMLKNGNRKQQIIFYHMSICSEIYDHVQTLNLMAKILSS